MAARNFYRVKDGVRHGANNQFGPGSIVEMTEAEAAGVLDKLVLVEGGEEPAQGETGEGRLVVSVPPKGAKGDAASAPPSVLPDEEPDDAQTISKADVKKAVKSAKASGEGEV